MARKRESEEELLKTHVLNLNEIREAEKKEQHKKVKKVPKYLSIIGLFLIVFGLVTVKAGSLLMKSKETKKETVQYATKLEKNSIICLSEFYNDTNTYKISTKSTDGFNALGLISRKTVTEINLTDKGDMATLNALCEHYKQLYKDTNGIINKIYIQGKTLYFEQEILDYSRFDVSTYNQEINQFNKTTVFKGKENMSKVKEREISLGNSCS